MQCSFQLSQVSSEKTSNGISFFHSSYCNYTHVQKNPVASLQEHWVNSSPFDSTNWLPASLPSFEPLPLPQLIVTAENQNQGWKGSLWSCTASPSISVHADIPSDTSLRLRLHLPHYIHTFGVKLAYVRNFGSFFASPPCQGAQWATTTSRIPHCLAVQRLPHCPQAAGRALLQHRCHCTVWGEWRWGETEPGPPDTGSGLLSVFALAAAT